MSSKSLSTPRRILKALKKFMIILLIVLLVVAIAGFFYMQLPQFGKAPSGKRLERIKQSPNYKDGQFQNIHHTPMLTEGYSMIGNIYKFLFKKYPRTTPTDTIPSMKSDLLKLDPDSNILVWFGHSSYFLQVNGKRILMDPVFSGNASPVPGTTKSFMGTDVYSVDDLSEIDYLLISHDHYDHLDYKTILALKSKVKNVICGLGVGEHFEYWGYDTTKIIEKDWNETFSVDSNFRIHTASARHFSGRKLSRNISLWVSFIIDAPGHKIYLGGDSGYDTHFAEIGNKFGPFDLAILENGQYNEAWRGIHMLPEDVIQAATDLKTKKLFTVHSSKFKLALHPWDEPLEKIIDLTKARNLPLITPMIGEPVRLDDSSQVFKYWWKGLN